ncbi:hypothetical protein N7463_000943 [Penicillium fimorum]|uniref:Uncharacterized protein n=1 Tax=Penicillium fimorum TaxID=1882269 RepID=A0A9W9Y5A3_9EURO|nr:hypothetical protein N7463_000943 [Penicillium fimorum]
MSLADAAPASESPLPADYLARLEALGDRLLATLAPHEAFAFLWGIFSLYLALLAIWRLDYLYQRLTDRCLPPPPELPRPQPAQYYDFGGAGDSGE